MTSIGYIIFKIDMRSSFFLSLQTVYLSIPAELIKAGGGTIRCAIYKLIIAIWNKEELPGEWKESMIQLGGRPCTIFSLSLVSPRNG